MFIIPTKSAVFAQQRAGSLLRKNEGKQHALIFDWVYPGLDQILFREFVNDKAWVGVTPPATPLQPKIAERYKIEWQTPATPPASLSFSAPALPPELPFEHTMASLAPETACKETFFSLAPAAQASTAPTSVPNPDNFDIDDFLKLDFDPAEFFNLLP